MDRFAFLSDNWLSALERTAQRLLDDVATAPRPPFRYAEIFTNIPADLQGVVPVGYMLSFADGRAAVAKLSSEEEAADCRVRIDYDAALATTRLESGPEMDALIKRVFADGLMTMIGSPGDIPIDMGKLHDMLVEHTETPAG